MLRHDLQCHEDEAHEQASGKIEEQQMQTVEQKLEHLSKSGVPEAEQACEAIRKAMESVDSAHRVEG